MFLLVLGLIVFFASHLAFTVPGLRSTLVSRIGKWGWKGIVGAISLAGLILIVLGMKHAGHIGLWTPPPFARPIAVGLMPLAFILVIAAFFPCNLRRVVRHPMLLGIALWAGLHLLANGDLAGLLLFGSFFAYALFDLGVQWKNVVPEPRAYVPGYDMALVFIAVLAYAVILVLHPLLFGHAIVL